MELREALPLYPHWVETFNLKTDTEAIELLKAKIHGKVTNKQINSVECLGLRGCFISFQP